MYLLSELKFDEKQLLILNKLKEYAAQIDNKSFFNFFTDKTSVKKGVYLYGNVGNGKTVLMQYFYQLLSSKRLITHYQQFMQLIHADIHQLQNHRDSKNNVIKKIAYAYATKYKVICLDEFEIKDITDAMIIGPLIFELIKHKIFIFITSNTKPDSLYQDGLQRESFLPIIEKIFQIFDVLHLDSRHDYRKDKIIKLSQSRILYPMNDNNKLIMQKLILALNQEGRLAPRAVEVFGRLIHFKTANQHILATTFEELFLRQFSSIDYVNICQKFSIIVVENVHIIEPGNTDLAVRFINFVDNAYFYKVILFMCLETEPTKIYQNGHRSQEFQRTISRLYEMNSDAYANS
ncbi:cell division protein ZapE [Candidatus Tisiphia endosymbiont of Beris chalybata]|uniref:cell division protein ZapE n=1 Tax=Candidatus Tisiphia endosymbiont of Beris chalybata TaxID=3066262 RepID=UPI00312CBC70